MKKTAERYVCRYKKLKRIKDKMHSVYGSIDRSKGEKKERNT